MTATVITDFDVSPSTSGVPHLTEPERRTVLRSLVMLVCFGCVKLVERPTEIDEAGPAVPSSVPPAVCLDDTASDSGIYTPSNQSSSDSTYDRCPESPSSSKSTLKNRLKNRFSKLGWKRSSSGLRRIFQKRKIRKDDVSEDNSIKVDDTLTPPPSPSPLVNVRLADLKSDLSVEVLSNDPQLGTQIQQQDFEMDRGDYSFIDTSQVCQSTHSRIEFSARPKTRHFRLESSRTPAPTTCVTSPCRPDSSCSIEQHILYVHTPDSDTLARIGERKRITNLVINADDFEDIADVDLKAPHFSLLSAVSDIDDDFEW